MPTLQPQQVSGLVVTPTVEHDGSIYRVSLGIDVGVSRTPPGAAAAQVVSREDLVVELRSPAEGSLEAIASPDPGPLPVRALRVVQARGEFTYAQGVNPPTELLVNLRGDQATFPMATTLVPTGCLRRVPTEGAQFPGTSGTGLLAGLRTLPTILLPWRTGCCTRRFEAPHNRSVDATAKNEHFEMEADFSASGSRCRCKCCEYRQFVRGTFTDGAGASVRFDMPSGALDPARYCEDGAIDEFGTGKHGYYGHRATSSPGDEYGSQDGCKYRANETPSCPPTEGAQLEFIGLVVDRCRRRVVAKREWVVDL
jgi:hypothetical protein